MGRARCRSKDATLNRGSWTAEEDRILSEYVRVHGHGEWNSLPKKAGLKRCRKSCRLRWLNYLRPDIKRGNISPNKEDLIIKLHRLLGNRWSLIAARLPGRTDNEVKNHWNTYLTKRVSHKITPPKHRKSLKKSPHPVMVDRLFKPTPIRFTKSCTSNGIHGMSNLHDLPSTDATNSNTVNNLETWSDLLVEELMTGHDSEFVDFALTENMIDLESLSMEIWGHSPSSQLNLGNLQTAEHSHSETLWFSSSGECDFVNDLQILDFDNSPGDEWERVLSSMEEI